MILKIRAARHSVIVYTANGYSPNPINGDMKGGLNALV